MTIYNVGNAAELQAALASANGGDEIKLATGDYGNLRLTSNSGFNVQYSSPVTITSADPNAPATLGRVLLRDVGNLSFDNIAFDYNKAPNDASSTKFFEVSSSSNVSITNSTFQGETDSGGFGFGTAVFIRNSSGVTVENNDLDSWERGITAGQSSDIIIKGNEISGTSSDAMQFTEVNNILIENNYLHDSAASPTGGAHRDMIQFFSINQDTPSTDITIRGNTFDIGDGSWTQTIFMRNEAVDLQGAGTSMYYQNVVIENNTIYNTHTHGITIGATDGLVIQNNSVLQVDGNQNDPNNTGRLGSLYSPTIKIASVSTNVTVEENVVSQISGYNGQSSWTMTNNVLVQNTDPNASGYYGNMFSAASLADQSGAHDYVVKVGSLIDTLGAGAQSNWTPTSTTSGTSTTTTTTPDPTTTTTTPDPTTTTTTPDPTTTTTTPDPTTTTTAPDPTTTTTTPDPTTTATPDPAPSSQSGLPVIDDYTLDIASLVGSSALKDDTQVVGTPEGDVIQLDGKADYVQVGRLQQFEQSEQISFSVDFTRDHADGSTDKLVWNHMKYGLMLRKDGLKINVATADGSSKWFEAKNIGLNDLEEHNATVIIDSAIDRLQVIVDGDVVIDETSTDFDFVGNGGREWGWKLGGAWGRWFDGEISDFSVDASADFYDPALFQGDASLLG